MRSGQRDSKLCTCINMSHPLIKYLRFFIFGISILVADSLTKRCGSLRGLDLDKPFQPPDWIFGVVWPILYVLTGIAWYIKQGEADIILSLVTLLCSLWLPLFLCFDRRALAALCVASASVLSFLGVFVLGGVSGILLLPLGLWTGFATFLNIYNYQ